MSKRKGKEPEQEEEMLLNKKTMKSFDALISQNKLVDSDWCKNVSSEGVNVYCAHRSVILNNLRTPELDSVDYGFRE